MLKIDNVKNYLIVIALLANVRPGFTGAIATYTFTGDARDESGNEHHSHIYGTVLTEDRVGNPNWAYAFNGSSDYIDIGNETGLKPYLDLTIIAALN